jgi:hypothetical protein
VLALLCQAAPTHNVALIGADAYFFPRSPSGEIGETVPGLKIGTTQLLGHFVVDTVEQFEAATAPGAIECSLRGTRRTEGAQDLLLRVRDQLFAS